MLSHPTLNKLDTIGLEGMAQAFREQLESAQYRELSFEERFALLLDRELTLRDTKGFERRLKNARLRQDAALEDLDLKHPRRLDASLVRSLATGGWVCDKRNLIITGPTGVGKTHPGHNPLGHALVGNTNGAGPLPRSLSSDGHRHQIAAHPPG